MEHLQRDLVQSDSRKATKAESRRLTLQVIGSAMIAASSILQAGKSASGVSNLTLRSTFMPPIYLMCHLFAPSRTPLDLHLASYQMHNGNSTS